MSIALKLQRVWRGLGALALVVALTAVAAVGNSYRNSSVANRAREVLLGGLFSLTGDWSALGQTGRAAMELAVEDVNGYLEGNAAQVRFAVAIEDTRLDPKLALEKAKVLRARGVQLLIGAQTSAEVAHLKAFVDANGLLLVSPSSTAGTLTITGDNIFRFTPADSLEGVAVSALMWEDGIRVIVPLWREDPGNAGLEKATRARFTALGGTALAGVHYGAEVNDFSQTITGLYSQLRPAIEQYGKDRVAVYFAGLDDVKLFTSAANQAVLGSVRWYGSDGVANSEALLQNRASVEFAIRTNFPSPVFGLDEGAREIWQPLVERIRARTQLEPNAFALAVYDAVWVVARAYVASGAPLDIERLKHAFTTAAATGYGATGWTVLNEAGDRRHGDFDFWAIRMNGGKPQWIRTAKYESRTERLVRLSTGRVASR